MERVVFLDRDGTINEEVNYLHRPKDLVLLPGVIEGIRRLNRAGFRLVVVTNQAGIARGYYTEADVKALHEFLNDVLQKQSAHIDHFYYCPHHPVHGIGVYKKACGCRKPEPGLLAMAESCFEVNKLRSYMIGDKLADVEAGHRYGVKSVLVATGYGKGIHEDLMARGETPPYDHYAEDFSEAVNWILNREKPAGKG